MSLPVNVPVAEIMLGGSPRKIAFTLGAMRRIKEVTGHGIDEETDQRTVDVLGAYIWAMLVKEDRKGLTVEDVEDMLHPGNLESITEVFNKLVTASTGDAEGKANGAGSPSTLTNSGPLELETLVSQTVTSGI